MKLRVEFADAAEAQVNEVSSWWSEHRSAAPQLFDDELDAAIERLCVSPASVPVYARIGATEMRRLLLPRTRYHVYFAIEPEAIVIHAIWHAVRGQTPKL